MLRDLAGLPPTHHPEFRAPHHSSSIAALIGGTARATPGEISMAHGGVLFLDELTEFPRAVLNQLRQPLESGEICVSRAEHQHRYPARFQLVAAMNPCPCGFAGSDEQHCRCTPDRIWRYRQGVSGPLLDRIDLHITLSKPASTHLLSHQQEQDASHSARERVAHARRKQQARQGRPNRDLAGDGLLDACALSSGTRTFFGSAIVPTLRPLRKDGAPARSRSRSPGPPLFVEDPVPNWEVCAGPVATLSFLSSVCESSVWWPLTPKTLMRRLDSKVQSDYRTKN